MPFQAARTAVLQNSRASDQTANQLRRAVTAEPFIQAIAVECREIARRYLVIGQYLRIATENFQGERAGEWERLIEALPMERAKAHKLRQIYDVVTRCEIPADLLPEGWTTAFQLTCLPEPVLLRARDDDLIRPKMTAKDVKALAGPNPAEGNERPRKSINRQLVQLQESIDDILGAYRQIVTDGRWTHQGHDIPVIPFLELIARLRFLPEEDLIQTLSDVNNQLSDTFGDDYLRRFLNGEGPEQSGKRLELKLEEPVAPVPHTN